MGKMRIMNKWQRICILVVLILFLVITFFPPWQIQGQSETYQISHHFLYHKWPTRERFGANMTFIDLNYKRLFFEYSAIVISGALVFLLLKTKK